MVLCMVFEVRSPRCMKKAEEEKGAQHITSTNKLYWLLTSFHFHRVECTNVLLEMET